MKAVLTMLLFTASVSFGYSQYKVINHLQNLAYLDIESTGPASLYNLTGSALLSRDWGTGAVILNNGTQLVGIPVHFDIENNLLYFKKDSSVYAFPNNVAAFKMKYNDGAGKEREVYFKSDYPEGNGKPTSFLYQVVYDGQNVQLLKRLTSAIDQNYVYGSAADHYYVTYEDFYIYNAKKKMLVRISANKNSVEKALPDYIESIEKFTADHQYSLHNEYELNVLVSYLNLPGETK